MPGHVRAYLRGLGFRLQFEEMEGHIAAWDGWMRAVGDFYDYRDTDGFGRVYEVHRRSVMPAMRVCRELGSLLLDEKTQVVCDAPACTAWLERFFSDCGFWGRAQETVVRAFGLGTGTFAVWLDAGRGAVRVRHYDARMVVPRACPSAPSSSWCRLRAGRGPAADALAGARRDVPDRHRVLRRGGRLG